jgi:glutaredoxin-like protein NrdH
MSGYVIGNPAQGGGAMKLTHVDGEHKKDLVLYTLSTCVWCKKSKALLGDLHIAYDYVNLDELTGEERDRAVEQLKQWNPKCSFPSLVVDDATCVVGYDEKKIREALEL